MGDSRKAVLKIAYNNQQYISEKDLTQFKTNFGFLAKLTFWRKKIQTTEEAFLNLKCFFVEILKG